MFQSEQWVLDLFPLVHNGSYWSSPTRLVIDLKSKYEHWMMWFRLSDFKLYLEWGRLGFEFSQKWDMDSHGDSVSDLMWLLASVNWAKYQSATDLVPPKETTVTDLSSHMVISFFKFLACVGPHLKTASKMRCDATTHYPIRCSLLNSLTFLDASKQVNG